MEAQRWRDRESQRWRGSETRRGRDADREERVGRGEAARSGGPAWVVWVLPGSPAGDTDQAGPASSCEDYTEGVLGGGPGFPSRVGAPMGEKAEDGGPLRLGHPIPILAWELPGPLSACLCLLVALSLAHSNLRYFLLSRFHQEPAWLTLALRPRESQGAQHQLWFSLPPTLGNVDGGCLPRSPDGGIPGPSDNRLPSNLLAWNSLPGLSPLGQLWERARGKGGRGGGTPGPPRPPPEPRDWEAQGHRATLTRTLAALGSFGR